ncbi:TPA: PQQ-like beta-propeller repeat protein [Bacillus pseudomycoides]|nr:PQQ-like beta-propeller repeat protein [Bacillus pseudomycoides]
MQGEQFEKEKKEARDIINKLSSITQGEQFEQGKYDLQAGFPFGQNWNRNSPYAGTENPKVKWEYKLYNKDVPYASGAPAFSAQPAIGRDGTLYVTTANKKLYAFNPDGSVKWVKEDIASGTTPVIAEDGTIYVVLGKITAVNPDGSIKWQTKSSVSTIGPVLDRDGTIYVRVGNQLEAYNPDGSKKWSSNEILPVSGGGLLSKDGTIYTLEVYLENKYLYAHDKNGKMLWKKAIDGKPSGFALGLNGEIFLNTRDKLYVYDKNGNIVHQWKAKDKEVFLGAPTISSTDGTIYVGGEGYIYAYNPDYSLKWKYPIPTKRDVKDVPVIDKNGVIYFKTYDEMYALNPDATLKWKMPKSTSDFSGSITIGKDGTLYTNGYLPLPNNGTYYSFIAIGDSYTDNVCTKESTFMEVLKSLEAKSKNAKLTEEEKKEAREILKRLSDDLDKKDN